MGVSRFIAERLASSRGEADSQSRISNRIAWISVCISFAVMIVAIAIVSGFKTEIKSKLSGFMGSVMLIAPGQGPVNEHWPFEDTLSYLPRIQQLEGVESVNGVVYSSGLLKTDDNIEGICFKGVDSLYDFSFFRNCLVEGELPRTTGRMSNEVLLSRTTASKMGYRCGDNIVVYFIGDDVKVRKFTISGLFEAGLEDIDSRFAVADIRQLRRVNGWESSDISCLEIRTLPLYPIELIEGQVSDIEFEFSGEDETPLFTMSIKDMYGPIFDWLNLLDLNVLMILVLMIIVAGFNMLSAVLIILFEHISTIGLLKSLGMSSREVGRVFLLRSWNIVGKGLLWGNVLGIGLCLIQKFTGLVKLDSANYFVNCVPIHLSVVQLLLLDVAASALIMLIISLSTHFISKISPDRTMRVE